MNEFQQERQFTRRAMLLAGLQLAGFGVLAGRLTWLQLIQGTRYRNLAEENRISTVMLAPARGQILDRAGVVMATTGTNYQATVVPEQTEDLEALLTRFTQLIPLDAEAQKRIRRDLKRHRAYTPVLLKDHLNWDELALLELRLHEMQGLQIDVGSIRAYPYPLATAHVLGYVAPVTEREQTGDPVLELPDFQIGKGGIEKQYEQSLRGRAGNVQREVNAHGRAVRELAKNPPQAGAPLKLTIDAGLQQFVQQRLATEESAAAVVMDAHTGAVYALCSHPSFDPNHFTKGIDVTEWRTLLNDIHAPLTNKVVSGQYSPGSTFKLVTALAALEARAVSPEFSVNCPGHYDLGNHRFHCWKRGGHGAVNLQSAIAQSCDTYFYVVAQRVGIDAIQSTAEKLGLGTKTGIDIPVERAGMVPSRAWKLRRFKEEWQQGETLINAIGQGFVLATPLQLACMTARLVNGGRGVLPHVTPRDDTNFPIEGFNPKNLAIIQKAMDTVVNGGGTAGGSRILGEDGLPDAARAMGGKTGTSQVRRISKAERTTGVIPNEKRPWKDRDHALFVGFAPVAAPRFTCAVIVEHGGGGSHVAAPIARDILAEAQKRITG